MPLMICEVCLRPAETVVRDIRETTAEGAKWRTWEILGEHVRCKAHAREQLRLYADGRIFTKSEVQQMYALFKADVSA